MKKASSINNCENLVFTENHKPWGVKPTPNTLDSFGLIEILCIKNPLKE